MKQFLALITRNKALSLTECAREMEDRAAEQGQGKIGKELESRVQTQKQTTINEWTPKLVPIGKTIWKINTASDLVEVSVFIRIYIW